MDFDFKKIVNNKNITNLEKQVLEYIIDNIYEVKNMGIREIAKENYTSTSTIMRLSKKLGYTGFTDMLYNLESLAKGAVNDIGEVPENFSGINIEEILENIKDEDIDEFLHLMKGDGYIFIYATGFSRIIAEYLYKKLIVLGKQCIFSYGGDSYAVFENHLKNTSSLVVISKSGETPIVLEKVKTAKEKNIKVISFTREIDNSIAKNSNINFRIMDIHKLDDKNMYPNSFFPNIIGFIEYLTWREFKERGETN